MGTIKNDRDYRCYEDCKMQGCPGHKMTIEIQTTADVMTVYKDGEQWFNADPNEWETLIKYLGEIDYTFFPGIKINQ